MIVDSLAIYRRGPITNYFQSGEHNSITVFQFQFQFQSGLDETALMVSELGVKVYCDCVDISERENVYEAAERVKQTVGDVSILVNNAGAIRMDKWTKYLYC